MCVGLNFNLSLSLLKTNIYYDYYDEYLTYNYDDDYDDDYADRQTDKNNLSLINYFYW